MEQMVVLYKLSDRYCIFCLMVKVASKLITGSVTSELWCLL